jgi:hypothetical protein
VFARPIAFRPAANPPAALALHLGDGWGCATLHDGAHYCWVAAGRNARPIVAQHVAWLEDRWLGVGPDRVCVAADEHTVRCWRAPDFLTRPWWQMLSSADAPLREALSWRVARGDDATFAGSRQRVTDPTPVEHGGWRGCSEALCWGPIDRAPAPSLIPLCRAGPLAAPCAVADERALRDFEGIAHVGGVIVGDLFACLRSFDGVVCIGASRDGFFGSSRACPPELLRAWPIASGTVSAPNARCSREPVRLGTGKYFGNAGAAGPRGICLEAQSELPSQYRCFGAIAGLRGPSVPFATIAPGLGDEPSACGIDPDGQVQCWGAAYSTEPGRAVPIAFDVPERQGVAWSQPGHFEGACTVHRNCARDATPLPACSALSPLTTLKELFVFSRAYEGRIVHVLGQLVLAGLPAGEACGWLPAELRTQSGSKVKEIDYDSTPCCEQSGTAVAVTDGHNYVAIDGLTCSGDASRLCCDAPVLGQSVTVTGRLVFREWVQGSGPMWTLADAALCEARAR